MISFVVSPHLKKSASSLSSGKNQGLVKFALDNGQPIDSVVNGVYAIHAACCNNNVAVVRYLIEHGADVNARRLPRKYSPEKGVQTVGTTGSTPLHFAAANGCHNVVDILLRHGAIVDMTDKYGTSPLSVAAARNHPEVASLLHQYSAMQRGVQDLTPDTEAGDPWPERRGSTDTNRRGTAVVTPTSPSSTSTNTSTRSSSTGQPKDSNGQSSDPRGNSTTRVAGQRRVSLPSITESPSLPNIPAPPRQSCDFGRVPQSTEPLVRSTNFLRSTNSQPTRNNPNSMTLPLSRPSMDEHRRQEPIRRGMQRSHTTQGGEQQSKLLGDALGTPTMKRRKSMESAKFLSPTSAMTSVSRRKSFDQLSSLRDSDPKSRRSSDASSTSSEKTGSSRTTDTSMSDATPDSVSGMVTSLEYSHHQSSGSDIKGLYMNGRVSSGKSSQPSPLIRSVSQPVIDQVKPKRPPVSFASEGTVRQSLDIQRLTMNQERATESERLAGQLRNDSDSDLPGQLLRRRTMQDISLNPSRLSILPHHHTMGSTAHSSSPTTPEELPNGSPKGVQEAAPRLSTSSISSLSGSSTISGRFSRMWSSASSNMTAVGKENAASGTVMSNWNAGEFGEASAEAATQNLVRPELTRTRGVGMLNRLSGIWSRR
ncbi:hypothetical protein FBU30_006861 [Linnemannia zychae]|nr:hypothetical protein FBU30_006861 [Linnemannia zychae]